jgi:hypothetical protein
MYKMHARRRIPGRLRARGKGRRNGFCFLETDRSAKSPLFEEFIDHARIRLRCARLAYGRSAYSGARGMSSLATSEVQPV